MEKDRLAEDKQEVGGFSLVELIVVIAIIAVLVGVLTPAYLQYVEKSRRQTDDTVAGEIIHATEIVVFSGSYVVNQEVLVTFSADGIVVEETAMAGDLENYLSEFFGNLEDIKPKSKTYRDKVYKIKIKPIGEVTKDSTVIGVWE